MGITNEIEIKINLNSDEIQFLYAICTDNFSRNILSSIPDIISLLDKLKLSIENLLDVDDKMEIDFLNLGIKTVIESPEAPLINDKFTSLIGDLSEKAQTAKNDIIKSINKEIDDALDAK